MKTISLDEAPKAFAFGPFVLIPERQVLLRDDAPVRLGNRALDILFALVERPGEIVGKRELMRRVWPNTVVEECNLKVNMAALRRALGDDPAVARYIATVTGRGYRFTAPVRGAGTPGQEQAPHSLLLTPHNLPFARTRIFGRAAAIEATRQDLQGSRLVTLLGPGGIGKTTVALAVAEQAIDSFKDGVWFVDLAPLRDPSLVVKAIAAAIGLAVESADVMTALCSHLREREMLLVLDSCEHVVDAVATCVTRLLTEGARLKVLATSREPLQLSRERSRRLGGLESPPSSPSLTAELALRFPAVQLFVDRAVDRIESFVLKDSEAATVAEICRRLDGMALAIEFAATQVDTFGVGGLFEQLNNRFPHFVGWRAGPERHRTLAAVLDWSYGLLSAGETKLLRAVSVFAGSFDAEGASVVSRVSTVDASVGLAELVSKSLVSVDIDGGAAAYRLLETTRTFCLEKLQSQGEEQEFRLRHAEHVCAILEQATVEWPLRPASEWGSAYGRMLDELRVALAWSSRYAAHQQVRIRLSVAGLMLWNHFSHTEECRVHVSQAVAELDAAGFNGTGVEMRLKAWLGGATMFTQGLRAEALRAMRRALEIAKRLEDTDYQLRCLRNIGIYEMFTGEHAAARQTLQDFLEVASVRDPTNVPEGETSLAIAELFLGQLQTARLRLERQRESDLMESTVSSVWNLSARMLDSQSVLSQILWLTGSPRAAQAMAEAAISGASNTRQHLSLNTALSYACGVYFWSGQFDECARHAAMLDEHVKRHGFFSRRPIVSFYQAALGCLRTDVSPDGAIGAIRSAIAECHAVNHLARMPFYVGTLAAMLLAHGRQNEASETIGSALSLAEEKGEKWCAPELLRVQASVLSAQGNVHQAEVTLRTSMQLAQQIGAASWSLRSATDLARLLGEDGRTADAILLLGAALGQIVEGEGFRDVEVARGLLASLGGG